MLKEQVFSIDKVIKSGKKTSKLDFMINDLIDLLFYINDMLEQVDPIFSFQLSNTFIQILAPVLLGSINSEVHSSYHVAIHVAYYLLVQIFMNFKYQSLVDTFAACLLGKNIPKSLLKVCSNSPPLSPPSIFDFDSDESVSNPIRCSMFAFLKCKDDNLVCLSLLLLQSIIINSGISKFLLQEFGLLSQKFFKLLNPNGFIAELAYQSDFEIVSALVTIYSAYPLFRYTVYQLVCKIFFELFCAKDFKIPTENDGFIRKACCDTILKLEKLLESKEFSEVLLDLFDEE